MLKKEFLLGINEHEYTPFFVWQVIREWNDVNFIPVEHVAKQTGVLEVRTMGLGAKTGKDPELFIPVVKSPALQTVHALVTGEIQSAAIGCQMSIHLDDWLPHILLANAGLSPEKVYDAALWLSQQNLNWEFSFHHLAVMQVENHLSSIVQQYSFLP